MKFNRILKCLFLIAFLISCKSNSSKLKGVENGTLIYGGIKIYVPIENHNYTYIDIITNIDNSERLLNRLNTFNQFFKTEMETPYESNTNVEPLEDEQTKFKKDEIIESVNKIKSKWEDIGYSNEKYRVYKDNINENLEYYCFEFENFIGLSAGDYVDVAYKVLGLPSKRKKELLEYESEGDIIIKIKFKEYNQRIASVQIFGHKAYKYLNKLNIKDNKYKYLGLKRLKIIELLGDEPIVGEDEMWCRDDGITVNFYCPSSDNNECKSIEVVF